ncbi:hypothetical protein [Halolamina rubra]|uniref:hypothetical protein n=1 Tax=Halolamina rubra TaxID=1380430 RepID=UPI001F1CEE6F|nr:hypothetical protein [Halolamina rubra]
MSEAGSDSGQTGRTDERGDAARVLIVEDEPDVAELYRNTVEAEGYDVDVANSVGAGATASPPRTTSRCWTGGSRTATARSCWRRSGTASSTSGSGW